MAAAYCSTFGGTGTLVGTGTNLTFKGIFEHTFPEADGINFTEWMIANIPQMLINSFLTWLYLRIAFMGYLRPNSEDAQIATIGAEGEEITNRVGLQYLSIFLFSFLICTIIIIVIVSQVMENRYQELGPMTFHESGVAILFGLCIVLWLFRKPGFVVGWSEVITDM